MLLSKSTSILDTDTGGNATFSLSYGTPTDGMLLSPLDYNYTSSNASAKVLTARVGESIEDNDINNGVFGGPYE